MEFITNCAQQLWFYYLIRHRKRKTLTPSGIFVLPQSKLPIGQRMDFQWNNVLRAISFAYVLKVGLIEQSYRNFKSLLMIIIIFTILTSKNGIFVAKVENTERTSTKKTTRSTRVDLTTVESSTVKLRAVLARLRGRPQHGAGAGRRGVTTSSSPLV